MAKSFVRFKQKGFWCDDSYLETWLYFFVKEIDEINEPPYWLKNIRQNWYLQATIGFSGSIELDLDSVITLSDRKMFLEEIAIKTNMKLSGYGEVLPQELLNTFTTKGKQWMASPETSTFIKVGLLFIELINERILATVSSPLDYLKPDNWKNLNYMI